MVNKMWQKAKKLAKSFARLQGNFPYFWGYLNSFKTFVFAKPKEAPVLKSILIHSITDEHTPCWSMYRTYAKFCTCIVWQNITKKNKNVQHRKYGPGASPSLWAQSWGGCHIPQRSLHSCMLDAPLGYWNCSWINHKVCEAQPVWRHTHGYLPSCRTLPLLLGLYSFPIPQRLGG